MRQLGVPEPRRSSKSPFAHLEPNEKLTIEVRFLDAFGLAVEAPIDSQVERLAYEELRSIHAEAIHELDDRAPSLMDSMIWAAERRYAEGLNVYARGSAP